MIAIEFEKENWKEELEKDLKVFGFSSISILHYPFKFSCLSRIVKVYGGSFYNVPEYYVERKNEITYFKATEFKKYIEQFEEKKNARNQSKKVLEFKNMIFDIKLHALLDDIPNLNFGVSWMMGKNIHYNFEFYKEYIGIELVSNASYIKLKDLDLTEEIWRFRTIKKSKKLKLPSIIELLKNQELHGLGNEYLNSIKACSDAAILNSRYTKTNLLENTEQSKKDYHWYRTEYDKTIQDRRTALNHFQLTLNSLL